MILLSQPPPQALFSVCLVCSVNTTSIAACQALHGATSLRLVSPLLSFTICPSSPQVLVEFISDDSYMRSSFFLERSYISEIIITCLLGHVYSGEFRCIIEHKQKTCSCRALNSSHFSLWDVLLNSCIFQSTAQGLFLGIFPQMWLGCFVLGLTVENLPQFNCSLVDGSFGFVFSCKGQRCVRLCSTWIFCHPAVTGTF